MEPQTRWIPGVRALGVCYVLGFLACLLTQTTVAHQHGPVVFSNLLFALILVFRTWLGQFSMIARDGADLIGQILSSAIVAVFFPASLALLRSDRQVVRVSAVISLASLILMAVWWGRFPNI